MEASTGPVDYPHDPTILWWIHRIEARAMGERFWNEVVKNETRRAG